MEIENPVWIAGMKAARRYGLASEYADYLLAQNEGEGLREALNGLNGLRIAEEFLSGGRPCDGAGSLIAWAMGGEVDGIPLVYPQETIIFKGGQGESIWIKHTKELTDWIDRFGRVGSAGFEAPSPITLELTEAGYLGIKQEQGAG